MSTRKRAVSIHFIMGFASVDAPSSAQTDACGQQASEQPMETEPPDPRATIVSEDGLSDRQLYNHVDCFDQTKCDHGVSPSEGMCLFLRSPSAPSVYVSRMQ